MSSSTLNTTATGSTSCSRASSTSGARASACTFVASTTVNNPRASRFPTTYRNTSNASPVASWLFSSSLTSPRQKSDDSTSVGLKCRRPNVDLPHPLGPTRTTRQSSGRVRFMREVVRCRRPLLASAAGRRRRVAVVVRQFDFRQREEGGADGGRDAIGTIHLPAALVIERIDRPGRPYDDVSE